MLQDIQTDLSTVNPLLVKPPTNVRKGLDQEQVELTIPRVLLFVPLVFRLLQAFGGAITATAYRGAFIMNSSHIARGILRLCIEHSL